MVLTDGVDPVVTALAEQQAELTDVREQSDQHHPDPTGARALHHEDDGEGGQKKAKRHEKQWG